jgi:hypothetical protein
MTAEPSVRDRAAEVLLAHQRYGAGSCSCEFDKWGASFSQHQADALAAAGLLVGTSKSEAVSLAVAADEPTRVAHLNPDCRGGKHAACSGTAWDDDTDQLTGCACDCHTEEA